MVPSSPITIAVDGESLMCGGFFFGETIHLGNFELIADYFGDLSLSPRKGDEGTACMDSTRSGASTLQWAMVEDSADEFPMVSIREGSFSLPSPRWRSTGASLTPSRTTPRIDNAPAPQCHTWFLCQKQVLIACAPRIIYSTHTDQKCSQITKCHE
jgi:hypothetical protein